MKYVTQADEDKAELVRIANTLLHVVVLETKRPRVGIAALLAAAAHAAQTCNVSAEDFASLVNLALDHLAEAPRNETR